MNMTIIYSYREQIFITIIAITVAIVNCHSHRDTEICSHWNGRRHFLELGERGELHGFNTSVSSVRSSLYALSNSGSRNKSIIWYQCNLELVTCAECVIRVTFTYANFSRICKEPNNNVGIPSSRCPCEHMYFSEPPYDTEISGQYYCGDGKVFRSQTRSLRLRFVYQGSQRHMFSLQYFSERNVKILSGTPQQTIVGNYSSKNLPQIIATPFFPTFYPRDYGIEYILSCDSDNCHVRLTFLDFQIGLTSTMEVFDSNGQMLDTYTGEHFRPPVLLSTGKSLLLRFNGNGATGLGYAAEVSFLSEKQTKERETKPFTDCGGIVESLGGAITMMNMIDNATEFRYYDCIWIIKPPNSYMLMKTHISLRIDSFHGMASKSSLVIRQGATSNSPELETIAWPNSGLSEKNHLVPVTSGFYVRLKGAFGMSSRLAIVYSVFNYMNCYIGSEFLCGNNRCIAKRLHCDGFDNCGDNSDEPEECEDDWSHLSIDRRWYSHTPNYYFPKIDRYPDMKTTTGLFIMSSLGLLLVVSGWLVILYRISMRTRSQRQLQSHLQTISEFLDRQEELDIPDEPPVYEAPPDYEEVIKVGMDDQIDTTHRRQRRNGRRHKSHNARGCGRDTANPLEGSNVSTQSDENTPCTSASVTRAQLQHEQLQDIANQVLTATNYCEVAETSSSQKRFSRIDKGCQTITTSDSISQSNLQVQPIQQENSNYSLATATQFDESSSEFRDKPLNVSLSLSMPKAPLGEITSLYENREYYTETSRLKNTSLTFYDREIPQNCKLRNRFSIPDTFLDDVFLHQAMNYGSYLRSDRNSFLSNASTFGSDLPKDPSPIQHQFSRNESNLQERSSMDDIDDNRRRSFGLQSICDSDHMTDSDVSCFGNVHIFGGNRRQKHVRSKSFSQYDMRSRNIRLKRSSSADLLVLSPFKRSADASLSSSHSRKFLKTNCS